MFEAEIRGLPAGKWRLVKAHSAWLSQEKVFVLAGLQLLGQPFGHGFYVWAGLVEEAKKMEAEASRLELRENRVKPWSFSFLPGCQGVCYSSYGQFQFQHAAWLRSKIAKAKRSWADFAEKTEGWRTKRRPGKSTCRWQSKNAIRETAGFVDLLGQELPDLHEAREELLDLPGGICYKLAFTGRDSAEREAEWKKKMEAAREEVHF